MKTSHNGVSACDARVLFSFNTFVSFFCMYYSHSRSFKLCANFHVYGPCPWDVSTGHVYGGGRGCQKMSTASVYRTLVSRKELLLCCGPE